MARSTPFRLNVVFNAAGCPRAVSDLDTGAGVEELYVSADDTVTWHGSRDFDVVFDDESPFVGWSSVRKGRNSRTRKVEGVVKSGLPSGRSFKYSIVAEAGTLDPQIIIQD